MGAGGETCYSYATLQTHSTLLMFHEVWLRRVWQTVHGEFLTVMLEIQGGRWVWLAAYGLDCRFTVYAFLLTPTLCLCVKKGKNSKLSCTFWEIVLSLSNEKQIQGCGEGVWRDFSPISATIGGVTLSEWIPLPGPLSSQVSSEEVGLENHICFRSSIPGNMECQFDGICRLWDLSFRTIR